MSCSSKHTHTFVTQLSLTTVSALAPGARSCASPNPERLAPPSFLGSLHQPGRPRIVEAPERVPSAQDARRIWMVCVFYYCRTYSYYKAVLVGEEESGGHVL